VTGEEGHRPHIMSPHEVEVLKWLLRESGNTDVTPTSPHKVEVLKWRLRERGKTDVTPMSPHEVEVLQRCPGRTTLNHPCIGLNGVKGQGHQTKVACRIMRRRLGFSLGSRHGVVAHGLSTRGNRLLH